MPKASSEVKEVQDARGEEPLKRCDSIGPDSTAGTKHAKVKSSEADSFPNPSGKLSRFNQDGRNNSWAREVGGLRSISTDDG